MFELITDILAFAASLAVLYMIVRNGKDIRDLNYRQNALEEKISNMESDA